MLPIYFIVAHLGEVGRVSGAIWTTLGCYILKSLILLAKEKFAESVYNQLNAASNELRFSLTILSSLIINRP